MSEGLLTGVSKALSKKLPEKDNESGMILVFRYCALAVYFLVNYLLLLLFALVAVRLVPFENPDALKAVSVVSSLVGFAFLQRFTFWFLNESPSQFLSSLRIKRIYVAFANGLLALLSLYLYFFVIPWVSETSFSRGEQAYDNGRWATALKLFRYSLSVNPNNNSAQIAIGRVYAALNQNQKAIEHYQLGLEKKDFNLVAANELARLYLSDSATTLQALNLLESLQVHMEMSIRSAAHEKASQQEEKQRTLGVIYKNIAWAYWKLQAYEDARRYIALSVDALKLIPGALNDHPGVYCLHSLIANHVSEMDVSPEIRQLCVDSKKRLKEGEKMLYVEVRKIHSKQNSTE